MRYGVHTVVNGDTINELAKEYNTSITTIVRLNSSKYPSLLTNPYAIFVGWKLKIPTVLNGANTLILG